MNQLLLSLLLLTEASTVGAPAPFMKPARPDRRWKADLEMVLAAFNGRDAKHAAAFVLSAKCLDDVLTAREVQALGRFGVVQDRRRWLAERLEAGMFGEGTRVLIRLTRCPEEDGRVILRVMTNQFRPTSL